MLPRLHMIHCLIAAGLLGTLSLQAQVVKRPLKPIRPLKLIKIQPAPSNTTIKPEIQTVTVEDSGFGLNWLVTVKNTGTASTPSDMILATSREANPPLNAGSVAVPVTAPGGTAEVRLTLDPDPRVSDYTFRCVSKGAQYQAKTYGLGVPSLAVGVQALKEAPASTWVVRLQNTWAFTICQLKVQVLRMTVSSWENVEERVLDPLPAGAAIQLSGAWDPAAQQYKASVFVRRTPSEPWVEMAAATGNALP